MWISRKKEKIKNSNELEFAVFCIENVAAKLGVDFGRGLYVTPLYEQAAKWCGK